MGSLHCKFTPFPFVISILGEIFWDYANNLFLLKLSPMNFSTINGSYVQQLLRYLPNGDFLFPSLLLYFLIKILLEENAVLPLPFIQWIFILFCGVKSNTIISLLKLFQPWPLGGPPGWPGCPFGMPLSVFEHFLNFLAPQDVLGSSNTFPALVLEPNTSLQGTLVPFIGVCCLETKIWRLGWSLLLGVIALRASQQAELGNTCILTQLHFYICLDIKNYEFILVTPIPI